MIALFILGLKTSNNLQTFKYKNNIEEYFTKTIFYKDVKNLKQSKPKI